MATKLDSEEYFQLALHASSARNYHACMQYLHELLDREPNHARALYLLGAQHAELGLLDRAIVEMEHALEQDEDLEVARLQLGLLLLDCKRISQAKEHLCKLDRSSEPALRACAEAMVAVADDEWDLAIRKLSSPSLLSSPNKSFALSMRRLLETYVHEVRGAEKAQGKRASRTAGGLRHDSLM